jgi:hypothetical protein
MNVKQNVLIRVDFHDAYLLTFKYMYYFAC